MTDQLADLGEPDRFQEQAIEAGLACAHVVLETHASGQRDEIRVPARPTAQLARDLETLEIGQPQVDQRDMRLERVGALDRRASSGHEVTLAAEQVKAVRDHFGGVRVVIDDEDPPSTSACAHGHHLLRSRPRGAHALQARRGGVLSTMQRGPVSAVRGSERWRTLVHSDW